MPELSFAFISLSFQSSMKCEYNENIGSDQLTNATGTGSLGQETASLEMYGSEAHSRAGK